MSTDVRRGFHPAGIPEGCHRVASPINVRISAVSFAASRLGVRSRASPTESLPSAPTRSRSPPPSLPFPIADPLTAPALDRKPSPQPSPGGRGSGEATGKRQRRWEIVRPIDFSQGRANDWPTSNPSTVIERSLPSPSGRGAGGEGNVGPHWLGGVVAPRSPGPFTWILSCRASPPLQWGADHPED